MEINESSGATVLMPTIRSKSLRSTRSTASSLDVVREQLQPRFANPSRMYDPTGLSESTRPLNRWKVDGCFNASDSPCFSLSSQHLLPHKISKAHFLAISNAGSMILRAVFWPVPSFTCVPAVPMPSQQPMHHERRNQEERRHHDVISDHNRSLHEPQYTLIATRAPCCDGRHDPPLHWSSHP